MLAASSDTIPGVVKLPLAPRGHELQSRLRRTARDLAAKQRYKSRLLGGAPQNPTATAALLP
jgi:hypothetical protein